MQARWMVLVAAVLLAVPAAAQQASFSLEQKGTPTELEVTGGDRLDVEVGVNLTGEGFTCGEEVQAPVNVTAEASLPAQAPPNASVETTDTSKTFPIPAGEYQTGPYSQEANATVSAEAGSGLRENVTATLTISSSYPGGEHEACIPTEFSPAEAGPAEIELTIIADDPPEPEPEEPEDPPANETEPPANDSAQNETEEGNGIPLPWQAAPIATIATALAARRRVVGTEE